MKAATYTGSTPAGNIVRSFLGTRLSDSVDFTRWKLVLRDSRYELHCNYGIGKLNTNGFINAGVTVDVNRAYSKEENYFQFQTGTKVLNVVMLNANLLHFLNADKHLLTGNGGWSYTLNNIKPSGTDEVSIIATPTVFKDSIALRGLSARFRV